MKLRLLRVLQLLIRLLYDDNRHDDGYGYDYEVLLYDYDEAYNITVRRSRSSSSSSRERHRSVVVVTFASCIQNYTPVIFRDILYQYFFCGYTVYIKLQTSGGRLGGVTDSDPADQVGRSIGQQLTEVGRTERHRRHRVLCE